MHRDLHWRRQFLVARAPIEQLSHWKHLMFGAFHLYGHPDLEVNSISGSGRTIVLAGYLFDPADTEKSNLAILEEIVAHSQTFEEFTLRIKRYAGRYVLIYKDGGHCLLLQDALSLREVYYCTDTNLVVCGSQPNLLAQFANPEIHVTDDPDIQTFYRRDFAKRRAWVGDETYYGGVKHLLPNQYLDLDQRIVHRYWPTEQIKRIGLSEAVEKSCEFLEGIMAAATSRQKLMVAVTSGLDSRTVLAASRKVASSIYFFVNQERDLTARHPDIRIPRAIFDNIRIPFHVHLVPKEVDRAFREVFLSNTFFASERILPTIYNVYFKQHADKLNVLGCGEVGRTRWGSEPRRLTAYRMAHRLGYRDSPYATEACQKLLPEMMPVARKFGINVMTLLYWEQLRGNFAAMGNSESDIAIEEFDPFNSHALFEIFLGVEPKFTTYHNNILFRKMIERMWPELLRWPVNPPGDHIREKVAYLTKRFRLHPVIKNIQYRFDDAHYIKRTAKM